MKTKPPEIVSFPEQTCVFAKDQPEYRPLPAHIDRAADGLLTCCWKFSFWARVKILFTGKVWHQVLTFNRPLQPQLLLADKPPLATAALRRELEEVRKDYDELYEATQPTTLITPKGIKHII